MTQWDSITEGGDDMNFPYMNEIKRYDDEKKAFRGYNHTIRCSEDEFFDMENITNQYYPAIAPRHKRVRNRDVKNASAIISKGNSLYWVADGKMYKDGYEIEGMDYLYTTQMVSMGSYIVLFPDGIVYNTANNDDQEKIRKIYKSVSKMGASFEICKKDGAEMVYHDSEYYEENDPEDGDMLLTMVNGKSVLKVYSSTTSTWSETVTAYIKISSDGIGEGFEVGDGVEVKLEFYTKEDYEEFSYAKNIFVNESIGDHLDSVEEDEEEDPSDEDPSDEDPEDGVPEDEEEWEEHDLYSNFIIMDRSDDSIVITGLLDANHTIEGLGVKITRKLPEISHVTECNNRLWASSSDGKEIYCCKLGDPTNWYAYEGISTDSWAVTIGSDGFFTGAITYMGYPLFFKENSFIKIAVSSTGGHQLKETACRGVQDGCEKSLCMVNENLFYKSESAIMTYSGNLPTSISDVFGEVRYSDAVSGTIDGRYYISMKDKSDKYHMFVYDINVGCWTKEDNTQVTSFVKHDDDLLYIDAKDGILYGLNVNNTSDDKEEKNFKWMLESPVIDYRFNDSKYIRNYEITNKYIGRLNVRINLAHGTTVDFWIKYDDGEWEHKFGLTGYGTKTFTVPVIPHRCDHFSYRIIGRGDCKILSIVKSVEGGSDYNG